MFSVGITFQEITCCLCGCWWGFQLLNCDFPWKNYQMLFRNTSSLRIFFHSPIIAECRTVKTFDWSDFLADNHQNLVMLKQGKLDKVIARSLEVLFGWKTTSISSKFNTFKSFENLYAIFYCYWCPWAQHSYVLNCIGIISIAIFEQSCVDLCLW